MSINRCKNIDENLILRKKNFNVICRCVRFCRVKEVDCASRLCNDRSRSNSTNRNKRRRVIRVYWAKAKANQKPKLSTKAYNTTINRRNHHQDCEYRCTSVTLYYSSLCCLYTVT